MNLELVTNEIIENIFHVEFKNQYEITSTLIRMQEHYESPHFKDKVFSLDEFKEWYIANSPKGKETGEFTYYTDWNGFNFPSSVLKKFYDGDFNPLTKQEEHFLSLFKDRRENFYVISTHKEKPLDLKKVLRHEIGHALFLTNEVYRQGVLKLIGEMDSNHREELSSVLKSTGGYHEDVIVDETQAYLLSGIEKLNDKYGLEIKRYSKISKEINTLFDETLTSPLPK